jgi:uncharacterized protein YggE
MLIPKLECGPPTQHITMKHLVLLLCIVGSTVAAVTPDKPFIYSVGTAIAQVRPDVLVINFSVAATDLSQTKASEIAENKAASVFKVLRDFTIPQSDIEFANIFVSRAYRQNDTTPQGFTVTRRFMVRLRQVERVAEFVKQLSVVQVDNLQEILGEASNEDEIRETLKISAVEDARKKAEKIAGAAGVKVIGVYALSSTTPFENIESEFLKSERHNSRIGGFSQGINPPPPIEQTFKFPDLVFIQSIQVIYYISENQ